MLPLVFDDRLDGPAGVIPTVNGFGVKSSLRDAVGR
jgi:hypothetical protein